MSIFDQKKNGRKAKPVRVESVILREIWSVARDNFNDYVDHASRADVHRLNAYTALKPDTQSDEAYGHKAKPVRVESVILKEIWSVARDNFNDYVDHASRADVHRLNVYTAVKPDTQSDEAYA